jgi:hypothetical protein
MYSLIRKVRTAKDNITVRRSLYDYYFITSSTVLL